VYDWEDSVNLRPRIAVLALCSIAFAQTDDPKVALIKKGAGAIGTAMVAGKYGVVLDLTYPAILDLMGGRDKALGYVEEQLNAMKEKGISIVSFTAGDPSEIKAGGSELFAAIPTTIEMKAPQMKITGKSFLVAISQDQGKSWTFADGANLTPEIMKAMFPKFPPDLKLPEKSNSVEKVP
jgi:hypothetical protein